MIIQIISKLKRKICCSILPSSQNIFRSYKVQGKVGTQMYILVIDFTSCILLYFHLVFSCNSFLQLFCQAVGVLIVCLGQLIQSNKTPTTCVSLIILPHVLTAASKFIWAYNVKYCSKKLPDNFQWKCKVYFHCARFIIQLGHNLIIEIEDYQK